MRTLYVTDLDGTLLRKNETTSDFTNRAINELVSQGMLFSYATARSYVTSVKVTRGLSAKIPLIVYNGAFIRDNVTGEILLSNFFGDEIKLILDDLLSNGVYPIVYAFVDGEEKFSYLSEKSTQGVRDFVATRKGDHRSREVFSEEELCQGEVFYLSCIGDAGVLEPFYLKYREICHAVYQRDIYSGEQWLEFMPAAASKSNAIRQLRELLHCDRLVVFGDGKNDVDMFEIADESYAVANAVDELKAAATAVIGSNEDDGVAKWLLANAQYGGKIHE
ncbi:MAG: HAD family hydrolase [Clostridia bacterium]|nr:HAD family hydrolase [Clostridia bacterium]